MKHIAGVVALIWSGISAAASPSVDFYAKDPLVQAFMEMETPCPAHWIPPGEELNVSVFDHFKWSSANVGGGSTAGRYVIRSTGNLSQQWIVVDHDLVSAGTGKVIRSLRHTFAAEKMGPDQDIAFRVDQALIKKPDGTYGPYRSASGRAEDTFSTILNTLEAHCIQAQIKRSGKKRGAPRDIDALTIQDLGRKESQGFDVKRFLPPSLASALR